MNGGVSALARGRRCEEQGILLRQIAAGDEQLVKGGMALIAGLSIQDNLAVADQPQPVRLAASVRDAHAPDGNVIGGRHCDLHMAADGIAAIIEIGLVRRKGNVVLADAAGDGLGADRPQLAVLHVLYVDPEPPIVAGRIGAPTRQVNVLPTVEAAACVGDEEPITAIAQIMR